MQPLTGGKPIMLHTIQNAAMAVTVDSLGAQLMSITAAGGMEYMWNGDPAYWKGQIGRASCRERVSRSV